MPRKGEPSPLKGRVRRTTVENWQAFLDNPDDPRHGTDNGYKNLKCRCPKCRQANVEAVRLARIRRSQNVPADKHGKYTTYTNYACRCYPCTNANRIHAEEYNAKRRAAHALRSQ